MNIKLIKIVLLIILMLAIGLRVYKLDSVPPSISWDEAAVGYNTFTIANYGRDEYGKIFPLYFRSFGDDKHPVHFYATAFFVKILGLNEFSTRIPSAIFGTLNVLLIFFIGRILLKSTFVGLLVSFFLAISPYNLHFSRFNHEANFALFFFLLGLLLFYLSFKKAKFLPLSALSFGICFITYHPSKIVVPFIVILLTILYFKKLLNAKLNLLISASIIIFFTVLVIFNPQLLGIARVKQTSLGKEAVEKTKLFQLTNNELFGKINLTFIQYWWHFSPEYLFITGDKNPRLSSQTGQFYKIDALFLLTGLIYLLYRRTKGGFIVLAWALIAPIPSALVAEAPHAARASFMMGSWHLISALGFFTILNLLRKPIFKIVILSTTFIILSSSLFNYLSYYFGEYAKRYAIEWQYGMKQIVEYVKEHKDFDQVFMTDIRSQPYIFFLFYLKQPLPEYLNTVGYNESEESISFNTVSYFRGGGINFYFGGWDPIASKPNPGVLYVLSPSQYDGLRHKAQFDVKKLIQYPDGSDAFFIVSAK